MFTDDRLRWSFPLVPRAKLVVGNTGDLGESMLGEVMCVSMTPTISVDKMGRLPVITSQGGTPLAVDRPTQLYIWPSGFTFPLSVGWHPMKLRTKNSMSSCGLMCVTHVFACANNG